MPLYFVHFFLFICTSSNVFFIDGPGGTRETFLYYALLAIIRSRQMIVVVKTTLGVASSILHGGQTSHSMFKILINVDNSNLCNISKQSGTTEILRIEKLKIWNKTHKEWVIETLDRT